MLQQNSGSDLTASTQLSLPILFNEKSAQIEQWFMEQWTVEIPPIATSVDLRNSHFKLAPVDTNLFPAGFNNLSPHAFNMAVKAMRSTIQDSLSLGEAPSLILIVENHTRNLFYFQSVHILTSILQNAGFTVRLASLDSALEKPRTICLYTGKTKNAMEVPGSLEDTVLQVTSKMLGIETTYPSHPPLVNALEKQYLVLEPLKRKGDRLYLENFEPTFILLNNDLSSGIPAILEGLSQPVYPDIHLGWALRLKSNHFSCFNQVASAFSECLEMDPWHINPYFHAVDNLDFMSQKGIDNLAEQTQQVIDKIQKKYDQYHIPKKPFVIIKADNGTYGMSVMTIHEGDEVGHLNRKKRSHMAAIKGGQKVNRVIIQEGVYTFDRAKDGAVSEPVIYMIGKYVLGGFYRFHHDRQMNENLNSPGMKFEALPFHETSFPRTSLPPDLQAWTQTEMAKSEQNSPIFYSYSVVARLAALAAAKEGSAFSGKQR